MKRILLSILFLLGLFAGATHTPGGQVYWKSLGNNQYIIYMDIIDSGTPSYTGTQEDVETNIPGLNTISLNKVSQVTLGDTCTASGNNFAEYYHHFQSSMVVIPAPSAGAPWQFWHTGFLTGVSGQNIGSNAFVSIYSEMYLHGANKSSAKFTLENIFRNGNTNTYQFEPISMSADSVHVKFDYVMDYDMDTMQYVGGYSHVNPTSPNDVLYGSGRFESGNTGTYTAVLALSAVNWKGNLRGSKVTLTCGIVKGYLVDANNDPSLSISGSSVPLTSIDSNLISLKADCGSAIQIDFASSDFDMLGGLSQVVHPMLNEGTLQGRNYVKPSLSPISPQASLPSQSGSNFSFNWTVPGNLPKGTYRFVVSVMDNHCGQVGRAAKIIEIHNSGIFADEYDICSGDAVQLEAPFVGSSYQWVPSTGLTSDSTKITFASPTTTTTYTAFIDGDSVGVYTVNVGQNATPVVSQPQANQIELNNPQDFDEHSLMYYYFPIAFNDTLFTVNAPGHYNVVGRNAGCFDWSTTIDISQDSLVSSLVKTSMMNDSDLVILHPGDWYRLGVYCYSLSGFQYGVTQFVIPGATVDGASNGVKLVVDHYGQLDTLNATSLDGHSLLFDSGPHQGYIFAPGDSYTLIVDSGTVELPMFQNNTFPDYHYYGEYPSAEGMMGSDSLNSALIPFVMRGHYYASLEEEDQQFTVYPQPASDEIRVDGLTEECPYVLYSLDGRMVAQGTAQDRISISTLENGVYVLQITNEQVVKSVKIIVQH